MVRLNIYTYTDNNGIQSHNSWEFYIWNCWLWCNYFPLMELSNVVRLKWFEKTLTDGGLIICPTGLITSLTGLITTLTGLITTLAVLIISLIGLLTSPTKKPSYTWVKPHTTKLVPNLFRMTKLRIALCIQAAKCDLWSILHQWSKFHLVITFHCRVTTIFVKVVFVTHRKFEFSKIDFKNEQRNAIKFFCQLIKSLVETVRSMHKPYSDVQTVALCGTYQKSDPFLTNHNT